MGSGDLLNRNTRRRVEVFVEIRSEAVRNDINKIISALLRDNSNAWLMLPDGTYAKEQAEHMEVQDSQVILHTYFSNPIEQLVIKESFGSRVKQMIFRGKKYFY